MFVLKLLATAALVVAPLTSSALACPGHFPDPSGYAQYDDYERWIDIVNLSRNTAILTVQMSNIEDSDFGPDLLGSSTVIEAHETVRVEPAVHDGYCRFDALITYEDGSEVEVWDFNACESTEIRVSDTGWYSVNV